MKITQKEFREYRNKLLKQRKEILNDKRRDKMGKVINWIKRNVVLLGFASIFVMMLSTIIILLLQVHSYKYDRMETNTKIDKLLDANNSLAEKVVEFQEKEKQQVNNIRNYILRYYRTVPPIVAMEIAKNIIVASEKHNLPVATIIGVMEIESRFNAAAIGKKTEYGKARGLMQVMPMWWLKELNLNSKYELHGIETGINSGAHVLKKYLKEKNNNMEKALFKYVNGDYKYVNDVYKSMGKFIVFSGLYEEPKNEIVKEVNIQLDEQSTEKEEIETFTHTVKYRGETLSLIAKWYTGDVLNWKKIHKLNPNIIEKKMQIGATVILPIELVKTTNLLTKEYVQLN